ncbi:MAG: FtsQ-type POTRA domain-containing protein [Clostridia bacterium]|nr:FtsQ-type POTRA domain-containing protein [Clostridia bacterium]
MSNTRDRDEFLRKRAIRQRKQKRRRLITSFFVFIITAICVLITLCLTVFFPIENLTATGSKVYTNEEIIKVSGIKKGDNLFAINRSDVLNKLKQKLPYIETVKFDRDFPDSLKIKVTDADEYAVYNLNGKFYTVSRSGWVLEENSEKPNKIFEIRGVKAKCKVGAAIEFKDEKQNELIERIYNALKQNSLNIDYIDITNELELEVGVSKRFDVDLGTSNNIEEKVKHLEKMIENLDKNAEGSINLSMWTIDNPKAAFVKKKSENQ